eukprot:Opistho-1_new@51054
MTVSRPNTPGQAHAAEAAAGSRPHTPASKLAAAEGARPHTPGKDGDKPASRVGSSANVAAAGSKHGSAANLAAAAAAEAKPASRTASAANVAAADARPHTPGQVSSRPGSANTADRHLHANPAAAAFWKEKFGSDIGRVAVATFFAELSSKFEIPLDLLETNQAKLGSHINTKGTPRDRRRVCGVCWRGRRQDEGALGRPPRSPRRWPRPRSRRRTRARGRRAQARRGRAQARRAMRRLNPLA